MFRVGHGRLLVRIVQGSRFKGSKLPELQLCMIERGNDGFEY
jgi:hypothetical protein